MRRLVGTLGLILAVAVAAGGRGAGENGGLSEAERRQFYRTAEGSEIYPLAWLKALKSSKTGKPFAENLERYGFLPDPGNPDGLPVGLAAFDSRGLERLGKMVGLNCAACHVGEMTCEGKRLRLDGA